MSVSLLRTFHDCCLFIVEILRIGHKIPNGHLRCTWTHPADKTAVAPPLPLPLSPLPYQYGTTCQWQSGSAAMVIILRKNVYAIDLPRLKWHFIVQLTDRNYSFRKTTILVSMMLSPDASTLFMQKRRRRGVYE